jgi:hypothetical protein
MISARTLATVHDDDATADWFYPTFCRRVSRDDKAAEAMASAIADRNRVIVELRPQMVELLPRRPDSLGAFRRGPARLGHGRCALR